MKKSGLTSTQSNWLIFLAIVAIVLLEVFDPRNDRATSPDTIIPSSNHPSGHLIK